MLAVVVPMGNAAAAAGPSSGSSATAPASPGYGPQPTPQQQYQQRYCRYYEQYYRQHYPQYYERYCGHAQPAPPVPYGPAPGYAQPAPPVPYGPAPGYAQPAPYGAAPGYAPAPAPEPEPEPEPPFFDLAAGTIFPLGFGPELGLELPARLLVRADLLWMPAFYGSAIVGIIDAFGKEGNVIGPTVEESLADSFVFQISAGWRPFTDFGLEIFGGYTGIVIAGDASPAVVASVVEDEDLKDRIESELVEDMPVDAHLHNFHIALGWRFLAVDDHLVIRLFAGYTQTLGASSSLEVPEQPDFADEMVDEFTERLDEIVTNDVKLPLFGLNVGYRF